MSSLDRYLQPAIDAQETEKQHAERVADQKRREEQYAHFEKLDRLVKSKDVQWLLTQFETRVKQEHDSALNVALPIDARNNAAQRHDIARDLHSFLEREHKVYLTRIEDEKAGHQ